MEEKGFGNIADILVFALLISTAITILSVSSPADPRTGSERYASSFAQSLLLSFQHLTADQLGGFEYSLDALGFELDFPFVGGSAKRELRHKTIAQLIAEDALLNLRTDIAGNYIALLRPNKAMDDELRTLLKSVLDRAISRRFGYRLRASTVPIDLKFVSLRFEIEIDDLSRARKQLCSESILLSLPTSNEELSQLVNNKFGVGFPQNLKTDLIIEISLELWSL
ncbi:MAG: hypothetical protein ABH852_04200 [Methanobacteriota archaeon]